MGLAEIDNSAQVTIREAAELAGVSMKAIRIWIKQGKVRAEKVEGKFGPTYAVWRDSLPTAYSGDGLPVEASERSSTDALAGQGRGVGHFMTGVSVAQLYQQLQSDHMRLQREHGAAEALLMKTQQDLEFVRNQIPVLESHAKALETQALRAELLEKQAARAEEELATARAKIPDLAARAAKAEILESQVARAEAELRLARQRNTILYVACGILGPTALALIVRWVLLAAR